MPFHEGEILIQEQVGVRLMASRVGKGVNSYIFDSAIKFLQSLPLVVAASRDSSQRLWASFITGTPGFLHVINANTLFIQAQPHQHDPMNNSLERGNALGLIAIDFASRLRLRLNGIVANRTPEGLYIEAQEVYGNCPKHIQARDVIAMKDSTETQQPFPPAQQATVLNLEWQRIISEADTFFIASAHPNRGADASHRGGNPGFVRVINERQLVFPDYSGNMMFNTLGNLALNPSAGLLFPDFKTKGSLQLTGRAEIVWDKEQIASFPGAERLVRFEIDEVVAMHGSLGLSFGLPDYSRFNPR